MSSFPFSFILILYVARDTRVKQVHVMFATCLRLSFQRTVLLDLLYTLVYLKLAHAVITVSLHREQFSYVKRTQFSMRVSETISILCRTNPWKHFFFKESRVYFPLHEIHSKTQKQNGFPFYFLLLQSATKSPSSSEVEVLNTHQKVGNDLNGLWIPENQGTVSQHNVAISFWLLTCGTFFLLLFVYWL